MPHPIKTGNQEIIQKFVNAEEIAKELRSS